MTDQLTKWAFFYAMEFSALAVGGTQTLSVTTDAGTYFEVLSIHASANFGAAGTFISRSNLVGGDATAATPNFNPVNLASKAKLPRIAQTNIAEASNASLAHLLLSFQMNDLPWSNIPIRADLLSSEPGSVYFMPRPQLIVPRSTITCAVSNNLPAQMLAAATPAIEGQIVLCGVKSVGDPRQSRPNLR